MNKFDLVPLCNPDGNKAGYWYRACDIREVQAELYNGVPIVKILKEKDVVVRHATKNSSLQDVEKLVNSFAESINAARAGGDSWEDWTGNDNVQELNKELESLRGQIKQLRTQNSTLEKHMLDINQVTWKTTSLYGKALFVFACIASLTCVFGAFACAYAFML